MNDFAHPPSTIRLGDREVPRLGYGAMQIPGPGVWGEPTNPERARATLRKVVDLGIQVIDTAWFYGPHVSNRFIAETLHPYPKDLVFITKLGGKRLPDKGWASALRPEELRQGCEEDLRALKVDCVEVVNLRWMSHSEVPLKEAVDAMVALQQEGKIRHLSVSSVSLAELRQVVERTKIVGVENLYNTAEGEQRLKSLPHAQVADQEAIVDYCTEHKLVFLPFFTIGLPGRKYENPAVTAAAKRHGASAAQVAIAWQLARSPAILPIPGTSSPDHLEENWNARSLALSAEEFAAIRKARDLTT